MSTTQETVREHITLTIRPMVGVDIAFDDGRAIQLTAAEAGFLHRALWDFCGNGAESSYCVCYACGVISQRHDREEHGQ